MNRFWLGLLLLLLSVGVLGGFSLWPSVAHAENQPGEEEEYQRMTTIVVEYVAHEWWLVRWKENEITCRFLIEHTGWPTADEVETWCGKTKAQANPVQ